MVAHIRAKLLLVGVLSSLWKEEQSKGEVAILIHVGRASPPSHPRRVIRPPIPAGRSAADAPHERAYEHGPPRPACSKAQDTPATSGFVQPTRAASRAWYRCERVLMARQKSESRW